MPLSVAPPKASEMDSLADYTRNLNARIAQRRQEARAHAGEFVARSRDGMQSLMYAPTRRELLEKLRSAGHSLSSVVIGFVSGRPFAPGIECSSAEDD